MRKAIAANCALTLLLTSGPLLLRVEAEEPAEAAIKKGMMLTDAMKLLKVRGLTATEEMGAYGSSDPQEQMKLFVVRPQFDSSDALVICATAKVKEDNFSIKQLYWHVLYKEDANLPKGLRAFRRLDLQSIDLHVLLPNERARSFERSPQRHENPFK